MSQQAFAHKLGVISLTIKKIENCQLWPGPELLETITDKFGIRPFELFMDSWTDGVISLNQFRHKWIERSSNLGENLRSECDSLDSEGVYRISHRVSVN